MKRLAVLACAVSLSMAGCNGSISPVTPSGIVRLASQLAGSQNVPPAISLEAGSSGTVQITMTPNSDGSYAAVFTLQLAGLIRAGVLPAAYAPMDAYGSIIVAGYIHQGAAGVPGPVVVPLPISQSAPITTPTSTAFLQISNVTISSSVASAILANPSGYYFNLYSAMNQTGVMRGQLARQ